MSKWRKHVTQSVHHVEAPREDQQIVQAVGSRGSNLIEVCQHQKPPLLRALALLSLTCSTLHVQRGCLQRTVCVRVVIAMGLHEAACLCSSLVSLNR